MKALALALVVTVATAAHAEPVTPEQRATARLVTPGTGPLAPLALAFTKGTKRTIELAIDAHDSFKGPSGAKDMIGPTLLLGGELSITDVDASGTATWQLAITSVAGRDVPSSQMSAAKYATEAHGMIGMKLHGTVTAHGQLGAVTVQPVAGDHRLDVDLGILQLSFRPLWPIVPVEPVGVGAHWTVELASKLVDGRDVVETMDFALAARDASSWRIEGASQLADAPAAKLREVSGHGSAVYTMRAGSFAPASVVKLLTDVTGPSSRLDPKSPPSTMRTDDGIAVTVR